MFNSDKMKCSRCKSKIKGGFDFCPYCGLDLRNPEKDMEDFGILGKNENFASPLAGAGGFGAFGITDKMIGSLVKSLMKNLDKQMRDLNPEVENLNNGIKIRFGRVPEEPEKKKKGTGGITKDQIKKMSGLPRVEAKTKVRRMSDKIVYHLAAPGINSVEDVFVSRLEEGYEVKAIGRRKVYVNSLPVSLPLRGYSVSEKGLNVEFGLE